jgi:hypothetical protein
MSAKSDTPRLLGLFCARTVLTLVFLAAALISEVAPPAQAQTASADSVKTVRPSFPSTPT